MLIGTGAVYAQKTVSTNSAVQQNVSLKTMTGENVSLGDLKGKVVVLAVGATWLPLSKNQVLITNKLAKKYAGKDVVIYWVSTDSNLLKSKNYATDAQIEAFATRTKLSVDILRDVDSTTVKKFNVDQLPSFVIIDKKGKVTGEPFGGIMPEAENDLATQISLQIDDLLK